jgi:hypothetical protein
VPSGTPPLLFDPSVLNLHQSFGSGLGCFFCALDALQVLQ